MTRAAVVWGITGQIGAGKTTVGELFRELGAENLEVDAVGHDMLTVPTVRMALLEAFGNDILDPAGQVDRRLLGRVAFLSAASVTRLNGILHPVMVAEVRQRAERLLESGCPLVLINAALLFQMHLDEICSKILYVRASEETRLERLVGLRGWAPERAKARLNSQDPPPVKDSRVIWVDNQGDLAHLKALVTAIIAKELPGWKTGTR